MVSFISMKGMTPLTGSSKYLPDVPVTIPSNDILLSNRIFVADGLIDSVVNLLPVIQLFDTEGNICLELTLDTNEGRLKARSDLTVSHTYSTYSSFSQLFEESTQLI